jgi:hypothetical protein
VARNHVAFMLERGLEDKLLTHRDVVEGIAVDELATRLPKAELGRLIQCALQNADRGVPFTQTDLLATTPPRVLVQYVPLPHLWESVIVTKIAERHGYSASAPKPIATAIEEAFAADSEPSASKRSTSKSGKDKEASVVKLKQPGADPPLPKDKDAAPGVRKAGSDEAGDEYSEIDILEDEATVS